MTLVVFDWDGTVADIWTHYLEVTKQIFEEKGLDMPDQSILRASFGNHEWKGHESFGKTIDEQMRLRKETYKAFDERQNNPEELKLFKGLETIFHDCQSAGLSCAVATSRPRFTLLTAIDHHGIDGTISSYISGTCVEEYGLGHKPNPDALLWLSEKENRSTEDMIMIGDTYMDVQMAKNAGIKNIGVSWGVAGHENMKGYQPDIFCDTPEDLFENIKKLAA